VRFIPTPVGNTRRRDRDRQAVRVHPHACGEHHAGRCDKCICHGSSPRLWGTPLSIMVRPSFHRFIPTPVGNTRASRSPRKKTAVHPHACGEHSGSIFQAAKTRGSSPRLWGTQTGSKWKTMPERFIPTPVGNTSLHHPPHTRSSVHPHACGEHNSSEKAARGYAGSSPRLWGTLRF